MTTTLIYAPWTDEQVTALNGFQHHGRMHPFTCGAVHSSGRSPVLVATPAEWICPDPSCRYTQDWAHSFMAGPAAPVAAPPTGQADETTAEHHVVDGVKYLCHAADHYCPDEPHRLALSTALGLGTGAPWDAIRERAAEAEAPLSPDYEHPDCGFHWHGSDGMDIPMRDGQPVCPRCELRKVEKQLRHSDKRREELRVESLRRGRNVLEQSEKIRALERQIDSIRKQLGAEILRAGQAEAELRRLAAETPGPETQGGRSDGATDAEPSEEQIVREHVTTLHLIGEQLAAVESWMWAHLADVRATAPAVVAEPGKEG